MSHRAIRTRMRATWTWISGKMTRRKASNSPASTTAARRLELKVGTKDNQHIVSISPQDKGKGTDFALVFVQTRGGSKDTI